jgi:CheY-like chemotaxis protein
MVRQAFLVSQQVTRHDARPSSRAPVDECAVWRREPRIFVSEADRHDGNQGQAGPRGDVPSLDSRHATILIVDDDPMLLDTLADLIDLRMPHARVMTCGSGAHALTMAAVTQFDAIVTDVKMPHMDGLTLIRKLRVIQPATPVLIITGHGDQPLRAEADELGAFAFIPKPLDRETFMVWLQRALALRGSHGLG